LLRWASLVLTVPVVFYSAAPFFRNAWRDLRLRRAGMDVPVALGIGAAFAASVWATLTASGEVYFDSVTMFVFFLLSGRFLEMSRPTGSPPGSSPPCCCWRSPPASPGT
jgi:Cu2+-exporting ATPase